MDECDLLTFTQVQGLSTEECEDVNNRIPERKLLAAILERSILDLKSRDSSLRSEADDWFHERGKFKADDDCMDSEYGPLFSFRFICAYLDLDVNKIKTMAFSNTGRVGRFRATIRH